jgi:hypothetical protein
MAVPTGRLMHSGLQIMPVPGMAISGRLTAAPLGWLMPSGRIMFQDLLHIVLHDTLPEERPNSVRLRLRRNANYDIYHA